MPDGYEIIQVRGHVEVYLHGEFQFSADNYAEAMDELREEGVA